MVASPNEWPNAIRDITSIVANGKNITVTAPSHGFTQASDANTTVVHFSNVLGMRQVNRLFGKIISVDSTDVITVDVISRNFTSYTSGGQLKIVSGPPPYNPYQNIA